MIDYFPADFQLIIFKKKSYVLYVLYILCLIVGKAQFYCQHPGQRNTKPEEYIISFIVIIHM